MSDYTELKRLAEEQCISSDLGMFEDHQLCENILDLIAERDQLKADSEKLRDAGAVALRFLAFAFDEGVEGAELAGRAIENAIGAKS